MPNDGGIPKFPDSEVKLCCNEGDAVCHDALYIAPSHFFYFRDAPR